MEAKASHPVLYRPLPVSSSIPTGKSSRQAGQQLKPDFPGGIVNRACRCIVLALLARFSLHGQPCD